MEQLTRPLPAHVVDEMRWYFAACRDGGVDLDERYYRAQTAFAGPRFRALYRRWLMDGERVLDAVMSPVLVDVVARRVGGARVPGAAASVPASPLPWLAPHEEPEVEDESEALTEDGSGECLLPVPERVGACIGTRCRGVWLRTASAGKSVACTVSCALSRAGALPWTGGDLCRPACVGGEGSRGVNDPPPARPASPQARPRGRSRHGCPCQRS